MLLVTIIAIISLSINAYLLYLNKQEDKQMADLAKLGMITIAIVKSGGKLLDAKGNSIITTMEKE